MLSDSNRRKLITESIALSGLIMLACIMASMNGQFSTEIKMIVASVAGYLTRDVVARARGDNDGTR